MHLSVENIDVYYGAIKALNGVTIEISENGIYTVVGANGAGKTTLLNTIIGLVEPAKGNIIFNEQNVFGWDCTEVVKKGITLCPEGRQVFKTVTVYENLMAGAYVNQDRESIDENVEKVFSLFPRLKERKTQIAGTLSGGEQQMLAIGRALMPNPKLLLLDEPSLGLAPNLVDLVFDTVIEINENENIPILLVEQNADQALGIADYAYVLETGDLVLEGSGKELLDSEEVRNKYLGA